MFKSLLRTIPTLSGNLTLGCKLDEFNKVDNDTFTSYIRNAIILPLQNKYYSKKIDINMYKGKWESDISRYFLYYSDHFYEENFEYLKDDYKYIDLSGIEESNARNKDYEFGCKRVSYNKLGYQFQFYAPIYIDNWHNFPEYFQISIQLTPTITKKIKIFIGKENGQNYILHYLKNYVKQINENVIHINQYNYICTYYGIDAKNGGLIEYKYDISNMMTNYVLSTTFDEQINKGFKSGNLIMRQIIPLSFLFNIDDILTPNEQKYFHYNTCKIFGSYYNKFNKPIDLYDFNIDYTNTQIYVSKFDKNSYTKKMILSDNIYGDINTSSLYNFYLHENNNESNKLKNKITPTFNKWKLLGSTDEYPYIINNSPNFILQNPDYNNLTYHGFPVNVNIFDAKCIIQGDSLILPTNKTNYNTYYYDTQDPTKVITPNSKNLEQYIKAFENTSNIFSIITENELSELPEIMFTNDKLWANVNNHVAYYKNVLYNFAMHNDLSKENIDKFGVFMNLHVRKFDPQTDNIMISKFVIDSKSKDVSKNVYVTDDIYSTNPKNIFSLESEYLPNAIMYQNELFELDKEEGSNAGNYIVNNAIAKSNKFFEWGNDIAYDFESNNELKGRGLTNIKFNSNELITGYVYFPMLQSDIYKIAKKCKNKVIIGLESNDVYDNIVKEYFDTDDNRNKLFISKASNSSKISIKYIYDEIIETFESFITIKNNKEIIDPTINNVTAFCLYFKKDTLVSENTLLKYKDSKYVKALLNIPQLTSHINKYVEKIDSTLRLEKYYEYVPMYNDNTIVRSTYFIEHKTQYNDLFVDFINIPQYIQPNNIYSFDKKPYPMYVKCTNKDQIECYVEHILHYYNRIYDKIKDVEYTPRQVLKRFNNNLINDIKYLYTIDKILCKATNGTYYYKNEIKPILKFPFFNKLYKTFNDSKKKKIWKSLGFDFIQYPTKWPLEESTIDGTRSMNVALFENCINNIFNDSNYTSRLYLLHYVYPYTTDLHNEISSPDIEKMTVNKSFFLYKSTDVYITDHYKEDKYIDTSIIGIIGNEAIENNYKDTETNRITLKNYLNSVTPKAYGTNPEVYGTTVNSYDNEYTIYIDNWKDYVWDEITPIDQHIDNYIESSKLFSILCENLYNYITNNISATNKIYQYVSETIIKEWLSNDNTSFKSNFDKSNGNVDNNIDVIRNLLTNIDDTNQSIMSIENIANIISYLRLYQTNNEGADYYIYNIKEIINNVIKKICKNVVESYIVENTNIHISSLKLYSKLLEILGIVIYKKYEANNVNNSKYIIKEYNGLNYLYILFDFTIDNRVSSFKVGHNLNSYSYINKINDNEFNTINVANVFEYILPIYNSNIINTFLNYYRDIISIPKNNVIKNNIILTLEKDENINNYFDTIGFGNDKVLYKMNTIKDTIISKYSLNRYFSYIVPLFVKVNETINNVFHIKYKNVINNINSDIMYKENISIHKHNPLRIYTYNNEILTYNVADQYEYKHFNDNLLYNLEGEFHISDIKLYTYQELLNLETNAIALSKFEEYICDKIKYITQNSIDKNILLFLFNKYQVTYESKFEKFDSSNSIKLYRLTYTYKLI